MNIENWTIWHYLGLGLVGWVLYDLIKEEEEDKINGNTKHVANPQEWLGEATNPKTTEFNNFWLAPNGVLYLSNYYEHGKVMRELMEEGLAPYDEFDEPEGWLRISSPNWYKVSVIGDAYLVTQRQIDTLFDLAQSAKQKEQDRWGEELMDEVNRLSSELT